MFKIITSLFIIITLLLSFNYSNAQKIDLATVIDSLMRPEFLKKYDGNVCYKMDYNLNLIDTIKKSNHYKIHIFSSNNQFKQFVRANKVALLVHIELLRWEGNKLVFTFQTTKVYWKMLKRKIPQFAVHAGIKFYLIFNCEKNKWELSFHNKVDK